MLWFSEDQEQQRVGTSSPTNLWQGVFLQWPAQLTSPSTIIHHEDNILRCSQCSVTSSKTMLCKMIFLKHSAPGEPFRTSVPGPSPSSCESQWLTNIPRGSENFGTKSGYQLFISSALPKIQASRPQPHSWYVV